MFERRLHDLLEISNFEGATLEALTVYRSLPANTYVSSTPYYLRALVYIPRSSAIYGTLHRQYEVWNELESVDRVSKMLDLSTGYTKRHFTKKHVTNYLKTRNIHSLVQAFPRLPGEAVWNFLFRWEGQ